MRRSLSGVFLLLACMSLCRALPAEAAVFWADAESVSDLTKGVRSRDITVCLVGDAVTSQPDRVRQIAEYLLQFEYTANIRFKTLNGQPLYDESLNNISNLACPGPSTQANGWDWYDGDIRLVIPGTSQPTNQFPVPGNGCYPLDNPGSSWSRPPWILNDQSSRACRFNLRLENDAPDSGPNAGVPYLNHTLHEFGHALGLGHEHIRNDVNDPACNEIYYTYTNQTDCEAAHHVWLNSQCTNGYYIGAYTKGFMTPYDRDSLMHYMFTTCGINGNYDFDGFSYYDMLALHILYPEDNRVAEFVGKTVIQAGETLSLQAAWEAKGAYINNVAKNFDWRLHIDIVTFASGTSSSFNVGGLPAATYTLDFSYDDVLDRHYSYSGPVHVMEPTKYKAAVAVLAMDYDIQANFTASPVSGGGPLYVSFTDHSHVGPTFWIWDFGDGSYSFSQNPAHLFTAPGSYTVKLTSYGPNENSTGQRTILVTSCQNLPVKISGLYRILDPYRSTIPEGYTGVPNPGTMRLQAIDFYNGDISFGSNKAIIVKGGYDCGFDVNPGYSTIHGKVTVGGAGGGTGYVAVERIIIK